MINHLPLGRAPTSEELRQRSRAPEIDTYWVTFEGGVARCRWCHESVSDDGCMCCVWTGSCGPFCGLREHNSKHCTCDRNGGLVFSASTGVNEHVAELIKDVPGNS